MDDVTQKREKLFKNLRIDGVGLLNALLIPLVFFLYMFAVVYYQETSLDTGKQPQSSIGNYGYS